MCSKSISRSHSGWESCDRGGRLWRRCTILKNRNGKKSPFPILRITLHGNSCCNFYATFAPGRRLCRSPALELKKMRIALYPFSQFCVFRAGFLADIRRVSDRSPTKMENRHLWHRTFFTGNGSIVAGPAKRKILCGSKNNLRLLCGQHPFSLPAD